VLEGKIVSSQSAVERQRQIEARPLVRHRAEHRAIDADDADMTKLNGHSVCLSVCLSGHSYVTEHIGACKTGTLHYETRRFAELDEEFYKFNTLRPYDLYINVYICLSVGIYRQNTTSTISGVFVVYLAT
jgi:hypothetical protein